MTFCLDSIIIRPENNEEIKSAVILFHGYGGNGKDISKLAMQWKRKLPNTIFFCPNGHETCSINPSGFQWFDLSKEDTKYILEESKKAEEKMKQFIDEVKNEFNLKNSKICLSGFSQGCMMAINLGLTADQEYSCIVGFSGKIIDQEDLKSRIKVSTKALFIHGDSDEIVSPNFMLEAKDFFIRNNIDVETYLVRYCDHSIPIPASSTALKYILKKI